VNLRNWYCLRRRGDDYGKGSKSDQSDHPYLPCLQEEIFLNLQ
jgi:hypothetical protein